MQKEKTLEKISGNSVLDREPPPTRQRLAAVHASATLIASDHVPLCVDLDGTLVKSDTFHDSVCLLLRTHPADLLRLPLWLAKGGKAAVKQQVSARVHLDPVHLPYNQPLLRFLEEESANHRPLYLVTGADSSLANRVAAHLPIFTAVLASDGLTNLTGLRKLDSLKARFPQFDYIGNASPDLPALSNSRLAYTANPTPGLASSLHAKAIPVRQSFLDRGPVFKTLLRAVRLHQWAKNILLFLPLLLSHQLSRASVASAITAFFCFSFVASANYLVNDLLDIESDRQHPRKRLRPFAAGDLPVTLGALTAALLLAASAALLPLLPLAFAAWLLIYILATTAYSLRLKRVALIDVLLLAGLYTLRLQAGGAATQTPISPWLSSFAVFLFLSLAMVKRFSELTNLQERGVTSTHGRGYRVSDLEQIRSFGTASAYAAVVVFSLYISRPDVSALYRHSGRLWLVVPLMLFWLHRVWLLASRGELDEDPVIFALRDPASLAVGLAIAIMAAFATF